MEKNLTTISDLMNEMGVEKKRLQKKRPSI